MKTNGEGVGRLAGRPQVAVTLLTERITRAMVAAGCHEQFDEPGDVLAAGDVLQQAVRGMLRRVAVGQTSPASYRTMRLGSLSIVAVGER